MSLSRLALRLTTVKAILGRTLAEDRVFDSMANPIDKKLSTETKPMVVVRTDDHEIEDIQGRELHSGNAKCELVFEIGLAARATAEASDGQQVVQLTFPHTDAGLELALDVMESQIVEALTNPSNDWSALWQEFVPRVISRDSRRAAANENGVHFAARQIIIVVDLLSDPIPGGGLIPGSAWETLIGLFEADLNFGAEIGPMIRALITGDEKSDWRRAAHALATPLAGVDFIGLGPVLAVEGMDPETDEPQELVAVDTLDDTTGQRLRFTDADDGIEEV